MTLWTVAHQARVLEWAAINLKEEMDRDPAVGVRNGEEA